MLWWEIFWKKDNWGFPLIRDLRVHGFISEYLTVLYFYIAFRIFSTCFICFLVDGILQSIYFRIFCSKDLITFENVYLLSCRFRCVDIFYTKSSFCETFTVRNFVTRILLIDTLYKFKSIKCWFSLYLHMYVLG